MIKQFITAVALTATLVAPAQAADSNDVLAGIIFGAIIGAHSERHRQPAPPVIVHQPPVVVMPEHNPHNRRGHVGYTRGYDDPNLVCGTSVLRTRRWVEVTETNCYGEILSVTRSPRY
jgi:hypothetical protein